MRRPMTSVSRILGLGVLAAVALAIAPGSAHAEGSDEHPILEEPRSRQGYWIAFGVSGMGVQAWENGHNRGVYDGYTGTFRIGQLLTQRFGLGLLVEYTGGYTTLGKGSDKGQLDGLSLEASYLVWRDLSVHAGFGLGVVLLKDDQALDPSYRAGGGSYLLVGASYDIFPLKKKLTGGWALTPVVDLHGSPDGDIHFLALLAGLQITWWSGLPDNMLRLPEE
jgi:hypothetical protein